MFSNERNIDNLQELYREIRKYLSLQKEYTRLEAVEKMSILLSTFTFVFILIVLGMVAVFYLMFSLSYFLAPMVGGLSASFLIITGLTLVLMAVTYFFRKRLFIHPITSFLANLFLNDATDEHER